MGVEGRAIFFLFLRCSDYLGVWGKITAIIFPAGWQQQKEAYFFVFLFIFSAEGIKRSLGNSQLELKPVTYEAAKRSSGNRFAYHCYPTCFEILVGMHKTHVRETTERLDTSTP